jgi:hypothetical protein
MEVQKMSRLKGARREDERFRKEGNKERLFER